jgi:hypothetical protein
MFQMTSFLNSFIVLATEKTLFILSQILLLLESNQYGVYLAVVGICLSIMDHYNKTYSRYFESTMLYTFNAIKRASFLSLGLMTITFLFALVFDVYFHNGVMNKIWIFYSQHQSSFVLFVASVLLVNKFIFIVLIVDLYQNNKVTAIGLLFTTSGVYFELKDSPNFDLISLGVIAFTLFIIFGNLNEKYKTASNLKKAEAHKY